MSDNEPLARALAALDQLSGADLSPAAAEIWQVVRNAVLEAQSGRSDLLEAAREARAFLAILNGYEAALEADAPDLIAELAEASETAEAALAKALNRIPLPEEGATALPGEEALLTLLDRFSDDDDDDDNDDDKEPRH